MKITGNAILTFLDAFILRISLWEMICFALLLKSWFPVCVAALLWGFIFCFVLLTGLLLITTAFQDSLTGNASHH